MMCEHELISGTQWVKRQKPEIVTISTFEQDIFASKPFTAIITQERGEQQLCEVKFSKEYIRVIHQGTAGYLVSIKDFLNRYAPYIPEQDLENQLAAAKARVEELEKDNARQKRLATISRLCKNVQACRAEKAETKIKQMEDAIKFDFERFMDFQRRAEQAEALLNETYTDEHSTVWTKPTAEAYAKVCMARDRWQQKAEQAEAQCALLKQENSKLAMASIEQPPYKQDLIDRLHRMEGALELAEKMSAAFAGYDLGAGASQAIYNFHKAKAALEEKP